METNRTSRLTVRSPDTSVPARWTGPQGTVTCVVDEDVLNVYVRPEAHPADWDLALALMSRIADPARYLPNAEPSALDGVEAWQIELVAS